jgi:hypothetical protein
MYEESSKEDKTFKAFLILVFKIMEVVGYVGLVVVLLAVGWTIWKSGWKELTEVIWPALGVCLLLVGSIWGAKLLNRLVA